LSLVVIIGVNVLGIIEVNNNRGGGGGGGGGGGVVVVVHPHNQPNV
jgi:hypothetical protein